MISLNEERVAESLRAGHSVMAAPPNRQAQEDSVAELHRRFLGRDAD